MGTSGTSRGTSPSASPSPSSNHGDFSQYTTQADCESAGGIWNATGKARGIYDPVINCEKK